MVPVEPTLLGDATHLVGLLEVDREKQHVGQLLLPFRENRHLAQTGSAAREPGIDNHLSALDEFVGPWIAIDVILGKMPWQRFTYLKF